MEDNGYVILHHIMSHFIFILPLSFVCLRHVLVYKGHIIVLVHKLAMVSETVAT